MALKSKRKARKKNCYEVLWPPHTQMCALLATFQGFITFRSPFVGSISHSGHNCFEFAQKPRKNSNIKPPPLDPNQKRLILTIISRMRMLTESFMKFYEIFSTQRSYNCESISEEISFCIAENWFRFILLPIE